jgi:hypothetical protein
VVVELTSCCHHFDVCRTRMACRCIFRNLRLGAIELDRATVWLLVSSCCEFDIQIDMMIACCEFNRRIEMMTACGEFDDQFEMMIARWLVSSTDTSTCYHILSSTDTSVELTAW